MTQNQTPHQVIAARVRELRKGRGWSAQRLAEALALAGVPWDRSVVANFENGRRAGVSVEEFLALAFVLDVAPVHLLVPTSDRSADGEHLHYRLLPAGPVSVPSFVRQWVRGQSPIGTVDARRYFSEVPDAEWERPAETWTPEMIERQSDAVRRADGER